MRKDWKHAARLSGGLRAQRDTAYSNHPFATVLCVSSVRFACMYALDLVHRASLATRAARAPNNSLDLTIANELLTRHHACHASKRRIMGTVSRNAWMVGIPSDFEPWSRGRRCVPQFDKTQSGGGNLRQWVLGAWNRIEAWDHRRFTCRQTGSTVITNAISVLHEL